MAEPVEGHGKNFRAYLPSFTIQGEGFVAETEVHSSGKPGHFENSYTVLDVVSATEFRTKDVGVSYNNWEEAEGFSPLTFIAEHYGAQPITKKELREKINAIKTAASRDKADSFLRPIYKHRYAGVVGVKLPDDLSESEKARFIEQFEQARGTRHNIIDLFAYGSLFCVGVTADRNVHFELEEDGLHCSTLGCAVLGITAGELPAKEDPEIMFWAVHAAARMLYPDGDIALLRVRNDASTPVSNVTGHSAHQVTYGGFWGPGEYFELHVRRDKETFEDMADALRKYDKRYFWLNQNWYRMTANYESAYLHRNYKFLS